jgi:hypothetical protein
MQGLDHFDHPRRCDVRRFMNFAYYLDSQTHLPNGLGILASFNVVYDYSS